MPRWIAAMALMVPVLGGLSATERPSSSASESGTFGGSLIDPPRAPK